jgi:protein involved in polysaccharide export with SLBB domain
MKAFLVVGMVVFLFCSASPLASQFIEGKKSESEETNPFLRRNSYEQLDLLEKYYQRIFTDQGRAQSLLSGANIGGDPTRLLGQSASVLEGRIDPAEYIVGPMDVLAISVFGVVPFSYTGPVTPEGTLIIPTIGEIAVAGETLANVKTKVQQALRKKYESGEISTTLWSLRSFKVTVAGVVKSPGAYVATPVDRVDRLVYLANLSAETSPIITADKKQEPPTLFQKTPENPEEIPISLRNLKLIRANGDTVDVDLVRYYATGDTRYNPYVLDKDVIWVPAQNLLGNSVSIYGGVRVPGRFEFHAGDSLMALLKIAQGPTALADLENVEIARFQPDGRQVEIINVNLQASHNGHATDIALQRNDRVFIRENLELREERTVIVKGEVRRPGAYALTHIGATLSEIIERAGGFTAEASIAESKVIRAYENPDELLKNPEYARLVDVRLTDLKPEDREYFNYETAIRREFVAVDFVKLFNHHEKSADVPLREGDEIYVPSLNKTVYVFGQVASPGHVTYLEGMDHRYYIEKAGGFGKQADRDKIRVLKRGTKAWMKPGEAGIEPGDEIFVSRATHRPFAYYFNFVRDIMQVTTGVATIAVLIIQINNK